MCERGQHTFKFIAHGDNAKGLNIDSSLFKYFVSCTSIDVSAF